jgi:hypothetical protein
VPGGAGCDSDFGGKVAVSGGAAGGRGDACLGVDFGGPSLLSMLEKLVAERGAPEFIRSNNGPEFVAQPLFGSRAYF